MRIGFTIIFNGEHHLKHNNWGENLARMLDRWIIIEGAAASNGSTSWCKNIPDKFMGKIETGFGSADLTKEVARGIAGANPHVELICRIGYWGSKDEMVNAAIKRIIGYVEHSNIFLWQLDIDEQWTKQQMDDAEKMLINSNGDCGCFHANHYVGKNLVAKGTWGEGNDPDNPEWNAYRRLWKWRGQRFESHEPPTLEGGNGKEVLLPQRFEHYAYYFDKDVEFKANYYQEYEDLYYKWLILQKERNFPQPISRLLNIGWVQDKTRIEKCV